MIADGPGSDPQGGSASLWLLAFVLVIWVAAAATVGVGQAMIARHRVAAAADLAALAAAGVLAGWQPTGAGAFDEATTVGSSACARAVEVGTANGGRIVGCTVTASSVQVVAELATHGLITMLPPGAVVTATARAGFS